MHGEMATYIVEEFDDNDSWSDYFAPSIPGKIQPITARAIMSSKYFSSTGINDDTKGRKDSR